MENNKSSLFRIVASRQEIKITQFYRLMQRKWYLFLLFAMLGAFLGLLYYNWVEPVYKSTATILYKSNVNQASLTTVFKDLELQSKNANIQDQVELLTSYYIISKALQNLNWEVSYYKLSFFKQMDLYKREPFIVIATKGYAQTLDVPLRIKPVSNEFYTIEANEKLDSFGIMKQVKFKGKGEFGIPFKNDFFNFTINKINTIPLEIGETYKIIFNDIHEMAVVYQEKMNAKLAGEGANLIHLELESSPHIRGVDFLNAIAKEYIQFGLDDKDKVAKYTVAFIDQQILGITDPLKYTSDELTAFRSQNRTVDLERESSLVVQKAQEIDKNAALLRIRLDYYKNILNYVGNTAQIKNLAAPSIVGVTDPALNSLVAKLAELYSERETLSYTVQPKNPILLDLNKQISYTQQSLKENINNLVTNTEAELVNINEQKQATNSQISTLPRTEQTLVNIKRSFDLKNSLYTFLLQKRAEAEIALASHEPDAQVIDQAYTTLPKLSKVIDIVAGLVLGLALPLIIVFIAVYTDKKLKTSGEISDQVALSIAGIVFQDRHNVELPVVEYPNSIVSESFRGLRSNLQFLSKKAPHQVFAVHSGIVGEGKSFISANLATLFALNGKKVLLVEGDLRRPVMHKIFSDDARQGLSDYLNGSILLQDVKRNTNIKNLDIVFAGSETKNPAELLNFDLLEDFITKTRAEYDYVIVDNAPLDIVNDAMQFIPLADINLFLLRVNFSTYKQLNFINKLTHQGMIKNMVLVVNNAPFDKQLANKYSIKYFNEKQN